MAALTHCVGIYPPLESSSKCQPPCAKSNEKGLIVFKTKTTVFRIKVGRVTIVHCFYLRMAFNTVPVHVVVIVFYDSEERKTTNRMSKRVAERELTDRNWDQEDEVEEVSVKAYYFNYYHNNKFNTSAKTLHTQFIGC